VRVLLVRSLFITPSYPIAETYTDSLGKFQFKFSHDINSIYSLQFEKSGFGISSRVDIEKGIEQDILVKMNRLNE